MTEHEHKRYSELIDHFFQDEDLLELLDLHTQVKINDMSLAIYEGGDVHGLSGKVAGVAELRTLLSEEPTGDYEEGRIEGTI